MEVIYLLTQAKRTNGTISKGCAVHFAPDDAKQAFHAYLSAYGYGHESGTDWCYAAVNDSLGAVIEKPVTWDGTIVPDIGE